MHRNDRTLVVIDNEDYAFLENNVIHINIEKLWKENPSIDKFVEEFSTSHTHEMVHLTLWKMECEGEPMGEELVVRSMLVLGLFRCFSKGWERFVSTVGMTVVTHNLLKLAAP